MVCEFYLNKAVDKKIELQKILIKKNPWELFKRHNM